MDVNDNPPEFERSSYFAAVRESALIGTVVTQVKATSRDIGINADITYSIAIGNEQGKFEIDAQGKDTIVMNPVFSLFKFLKGIFYLKKSLPIYIHIYICMPISMPILTMSRVTGWAFWWDLFLLSYCFSILGFFSSLFLFAFSILSLIAMAIGCLPLLHIFQLAQWD